jgi:hypothetical protein
MHPPNQRLRNLLFPPLLITKMGAAVYNEDAAFAGAAPFASVPPLLRPLLVLGLALVLPLPLPPLLLLPLHHCRFSGTAKFAGNATFACAAAFSGTATSAGAGACAGAASATTAFAVAATALLPLCWHYHLC